MSERACLAATRMHDSRRRAPPRLLPRRLPPTVLTMTRLYFAYGSNLDEEQMRARCPAAARGPRATLHHHALAFGGFSPRWQGAVASVVREKGRTVAGLLYQLTAGDVDSLDRHEGVPYAYEKVVRFVVDEHGRRRRVFTYVQPANTFEPWTPPAKYFVQIWRAYQRLGFDRAALAAAAGIQHP